MAKNPSNTSSDAPKKRGRPPKSTDNEDTLLQVNNSVDEQTKGSKADNADVVPPEVDEADNADAVPPEGTKTKTIKEVFISNISPTSYVIPQLNIEMRPGEMDLSASVSKDTLNQIRNNADTFNAVNGWDGKTLGIIVDVHKG